MVEYGSTHVIEMAVGEYSPTVINVVLVALALFLLSVIFDGMRVLAAAAAAAISAIVRAVGVLIVVLALSALVIYVVLKA
jgi:hypothetical protein